VDGEQSGSPYRTAVLWRIHVASALLVVPQFTVAAFGLAFLVDRHGFTAVDGGRLLAITQIGGATARLAAGWWSDRVGSRLRPLRQVSLGVAIILAALAAGAWSGSPLAVGVLLVAAVVTVSPNGLAFTAVAEFSGRAWAGRALGIQNTGQNAVASLTPPLIAAIIAGHGYGAAFALAAGLPLVAVGLVPVASVPAALVPAADVTARSADHPPEPPTDEVMAATTIPPTRTTSPTTINNPR
jgi:MFS family permease